MKKGGKEIDLDELEDENGAPHSENEKDGIGAVLDKYTHSLLLSAKFCKNTRCWISICENNLNIGLFAWSWRKP